MKGNRFFIVPVSVIALILSASSCLGLRPGPVPQLSRSWTKPQQLGQLPGRPDQSSFKMAASKANSNSPMLRSSFSGDIENPGKAGSSSDLFSGPSRKVREAEHFLTPELTLQKVIVPGQRVWSNGRLSNLPGELRQDTVNGGEISTVSSDKDRAGEPGNKVLVMLAELDDALSLKSIQKDPEEDEDNYDTDNSIISPDTNFHSSDDSASSSNTGDDLQRSKVTMESENQKKGQEKSNDGGSIPIRQQRWNTDTVRVWGKRAWEMDPVRVWGKRAWEMDPVRVWGKRAWEMDPVRVWGKRAWGVDPVRVWGKRALGY